MWSAIESENFASLNLILKSNVTLMISLHKQEDWEIYSQFFMPKFNIQLKLNYR